MGQFTIIRKLFSTVVGIAQSFLGVSSVIFAYILYYDYFGVQSLLGIPLKDIPLYALLLFIFGLVSVLSGLFLIRERSGS